MGDSLGFPSLDASIVTSPLRWCAPRYCCGAAHGTPFEHLLVGDQPRLGDPAGILLTLPWKALPSR